MDFLKWTNTDSVDNKLIDDQHKKMIAIVNQIHSAFVAMNKKKIVKLSNPDRCKIFNWKISFL